MNDPIPNVAVGRLFIRWLRADDFSSLSALADAVAHHRDVVPPAAPGTPLQIARTPFTRESIAAYVADGCSVVAVIDGRPVGYLLARPLAYLDERPLSVWVDDIVVRPDRRQQGIAAALYREFGDWARTAGLRALLTRVAPSDHAAQALHRRVGFEPHGGDALIWRLDDV